MAHDRMTHNILSARKRGGQPGNTNSVKQGVHTRQAKALRKKLREKIRDLDNARLLAIAALLAK